MDELSSFFLVTYLIGYVIALFSVFMLNRMSNEESSKIELHFALIISSLSYVLILMIILDSLDKKFKARLPFIKQHALNIYNKLNTKFMDLK